MINNSLKKFDPAVDKRVLIVLSGFIWSIVGVVLCSIAVRWLLQTTGQSALWLAAGGSVLSLLILRFIFLKILRKNIDRILSMEGKVCIFAFQPWKSYMIVMVMIGMGVTLRHSALPKPYLAVIYIGFGGAMILSSLIYYWNFFKCRND